MGDSSNNKSIVWVVCRGKQTFINSKPKMTVNLRIKDKDATKLTMRTATTQWSINLYLVIKAKNDACHFIILNLSN